MTWLNEEHYLRFEVGPGLQSFDPTFHLVRLSERGLATMIKTLPAFGNKEQAPKTIGERLMGAAKAGAIKGAGTAAVEASKYELAHLFLQLLS